MLPTKLPAKPGLQVVVLLLGRLILAGIFLAAGYLKLREPWLQFAVSLNGLKIVPDSLLEPVARTLPWCEVVLGLWILSGIGLRWSSALASLMLGAFFSVLVRSYAMGLQVDCGCFGSGEPLGPKTLARDGLMLALALGVTIAAFRTRTAGTGLPPADSSRTSPLPSGTEQSRPA
jgi:uncharacterized membrane protein YphA (DoxX/SURF4 family)